MRVSIQNIFRLLYYQGMLTRTYMSEYLYGTSVCVSIRKHAGNNRISFTQASAFR